MFLTLRDPSHDISVGVTCYRQVFDAVADVVSEGARVVVQAKPEWYAPRGQLSLRASEIRPVGVGELLARLEQLKKTLAGEGLFAPERKKALPFLPQLIGLVCGRASAAERDVLENARHRWPAVRFEVRNVPVQGVHAVPQVVQAVKELDALDDVDVIIVARGGGSVEDLLPFSDEQLVRAVAACRTPVVSAIGHEPDNPLLDHVADLRASTPTDAAKKVVPDVGEEYERVQWLRDRARRSVESFVDREERGLRQALARPVMEDPHRMIEVREEQVTSLAERGRLHARASPRPCRVGAVAHARARGGPVPRRDPQAGLRGAAEGRRGRRARRGRRGGGRDTAGAGRRGRIHRTGRERARTGRGRERTGRDREPGERMTTKTDEAALGYEQARDELIEVVRRLEAGGTSLEESLALWERGEELAKVCRRWLDGARARLDAALAESGPGGGADEEG